MMLAPLTHRLIIGLSKQQVDALKEVISHPCGLLTLCIQQRWKVLYKIVARVLAKKIRQRCRPGDTSKQTYFIGKQSFHRLPKMLTETTSILFMRGSNKGLHGGLM